MSPDEILEYPSRILSERERAAYFERGYVLLENAIDAHHLGKLRDAHDELLEQARRHRETCPPDFEFEEARGDGPYLRQVLCAADHHPELWAYAANPPLTDIVADVVGPNVMFRESGISFKSPGGRGFDWHQDIAFFPHSNLSPMMTLTFLADVTLEMGPTRVLPGSHRGEIYDHYDASGNWLGLMNEDGKARLSVGDAVDITGPAGSVLLTNCALVHAAGPNRAATPRPMVINGYSAADAVSFRDIPYRSRYRWRVVEGAPTLYVHNEPLRMKMPPDWGSYAGVRIDNLYQRQA